MFLPAGYFISSFLDSLILLWNSPRLWVSLAAQWALGNVYHGFPSTKFLVFNLGWEGGQSQVLKKKGVFIFLGFIVWSKIAKSYGKLILNVSRVRSQLYFLRQDVLLILELTDLSILSGQWAGTSMPVSLPYMLGLKECTPTPGFCLFVSTGTWDLISGLCTQAAGGLWTTRALHSPQWNLV